MICDKCGNEVKDGMKYCDKCGVEVIKEENKIKDKSISYCSRISFFNITPLLVFIDIVLILFTLCSATEFSTILAMAVISISASILIRNIQKGNNAKRVANLENRKKKIIEELRKSDFYASFVLLTLDNIGLMIDEKNKKIAIFNKIYEAPAIFNFENIKSSELIENGNQEIEGNSLGTYAVGQVFGTNAAIASTNDTKNIDGFCTSLYILIHTNGIGNDNPIIELINGKINKTSDTYKALYNLAKEMIIAIDKIVDINEKMKPVEKEIDKKENNKDEKIYTSAADEIKKFKELLDIGAITEKEYEKKKKELLK